MLDYLAVADPLSLADLTVLAGDVAAREAQDWGAAESRARGERAEDAVVYTAHPLFAQRALAALGDDGARHRRTDMVEVFSLHPSAHPATGCGWHRSRWTAMPRSRWLRSSTRRSRRCDWVT